MDIRVPPEGVRLHVGCGKKLLDGWINTDIEAMDGARREPDILCPAFKIPLPDNCAVELMAIHVWEHFYYWECEDVIKEWHRLLRRGGKLVLEMPDLLKCCSNVIYGVAGKDHPDQLGMWGLYGDPGERNPLMIHRWGWTFRTLAPYLQANGFVQCVEMDTVFHAPGRFRRDFRIEAIRGK